MPTRTHSLPGGPSPDGGNSMDSAGEGATAVGTIVFVSEGWLMLDPGSLMKW